jgi:hypothetical protein
MKKIITAVGTFAMAAVMMTSSAFATVQVGSVQGLVTGPGNNALVGANVHVVCAHTGTPAQDTTTDGSGYYYVVFSNGTCVNGDLVTVTASKSGVGSATRSDNMGAQGTSDIGNLHLDLSVIDVPVVPEFGLITGALALVTSAGSMVFLKRKV